MRRRDRRGGHRGPGRGPLLLVCLAGVLCIIGTAALAARYCTPPVGSYTPQPVQGSVGSVAYTQVETRIEQLQPEQLHLGDLILVNNEAPCEFALDTEEMVRIYDNKTSSYKVKAMELLVAPAVMQPLNELLDAFYAEYGDNAVNIISSYRSYEHQQEIYDERVRTDGQTEADRYVSLPGHSEHHTGLALDFSLYFENGRSRDFDGEGRYGWIHDNAYRYGFVVRYPTDKSELTGIAYEPWHFRYVGKVHATAMRNLGLCLEEYIELLRSYPYGGEHLRVECAGGEQYEVYFVAGYEVPLPTQREYTVSGNNVDGFIVTAAID